jgi:hypothetical protein
VARRKSEIKFETNVQSLAKHVIGLSQLADSTAAQFAKSMGNQVKTHYQTTVSTWATKPTFKVTIQQQKGLTRFSVGTTEPRYIGIDKGTGKWGSSKRSYIIRPRNPNGVLVFRSQYISATKPNSGTGGINTLRPTTASRSGELVFTKQVTHPGIKPRFFTRRIQRWVNANGKELYGRMLAVAFRKGKGK